MNFAVLCAPESWYLKDLRRAAADRHQILPLDFRQLTSSLEPSGEQFHAGLLNLRDVEAVLVRTMPPGTLEQVVFRMDLLARLEAAGKVVLNPARAVEAAVDKYLASAKLAAAGLATPRTRVCQKLNDAMLAFAELGGDVVVKPLFGGEGRGIARVNDEALAHRAFSMLANLGAVLYVQEFIPHDGFDLRVLVLGKQAWGMRRRNIHDWRTNVSRGAQAEPLEVTAELAELAHRAAAVVGAPLAGVDLLPARDGRLLVLEVNAVPGWRALQRVTGVDVAAQVLKYVAQRVAEGEKRS